MNPVLIPQILIPLVVLSVSKLSVPDRNIEPAVSTTPGIPDISIRKEVELKRGIQGPSRKRFDNSIDKARKDLYRYGYLVPKKTNYGEQVSLNKHMIPEIEGVLGIEP